LLAPLKAGERIRKPLRRDPRAAEGGVGRHPVLRRQVDQQVDAADPASNVPRPHERDAPLAENIKTISASAIPPSARLRHGETMASIAIIGSGFSGLCLGIQLKRAGLESFTIFETSDRLSGTWRDNTYPGAASDVA